jgi:hypothetical protein
VPFSTSQRHHRLRRWTRIGAIAGLLIAAIDLVFPTWLGQVSNVSRVSPDGAAENLGHLIAGLIGGALLFYLAALIANVFSGRADRRR